MEYICNKCNKKFNSNRALNAHAIAHKEGSRYKTSRIKYKNRKERDTIQCLNCDVIIEIIKGSSRQYCSNKCQMNYTLELAIKSGNYTKSNAYSWFKKNTEYKCSCCGINEWQGKPLTLQIDHIDGNNKNNTIENFRYLCPNCHTQTSTWGVKNASPEGYHRMKNNKRNKVLKC